MPAASSSETRTSWNKRKLELPQNDDVLDDDDNKIGPSSNPDDCEKNEVSRNRNGKFGANQTVQIGESGGVSEGGERISEFPLVIRRKMSELDMSAVGNASGQGRGRTSVLENISYGQLQTRSAMPSDSLALLGVGSVEERGECSYVIKPPRIVEGRGVVKKFGSDGRVHIVPMHADWFSPNTVHNLERQVVPHFFTGKTPDHTPEMYMECRNLIITKYIDNPEKRLSVSDCNILVSGVSVDDVSRILRFLDQWGIINYCADAPSLEPNKQGECLFEESNGELCVPSATLKLIDSLFKFDKPTSRIKAADIYPELACRSNSDSNFDRKLREQLSDNRCNYCSRPTDVVYYQSQKEIDVQLCPDCFHEGRFVPGHSSLDFVKANSMVEYGDLDEENWTDQETLLLLEGLQRHNGSWNEIVKHVGTKSKAQCILHFAQMPMDGAPLQNVELPSTSNSTGLRNSDDCGRLQSNLNGSRAGTSMEDSDCDSGFPFENSENPVMALIAFLASELGPRVAAACARASLAELLKDNSLTTSGSMTHVDSRYNDRMDGEENHHGEIKSSKEKMGGHSSWGQHDMKATPLSAAKVRAAAEAGLAAAATKAKAFADIEEREIQRLSANIINHQLKRLELKLKQFAEVETTLMRECENMEKARQRSSAEHAVLMKTQFSSAGVFRTGSSNIGPSNNTRDNRQQVMSGSPQPFVSGYGNNQSIQISQQAMYGLGPRLPLSTLHPSSSMFNAAGNSQPSFNHPILRPVSGTKSQV